MDLHNAPWQREVGPGWDVVLVPVQVARQAVLALDALSTNPVGAVFAIHGVWGFFLPPESDIPPWPARVQYLRSPSQVTLPPSCLTRDTSGGGTGWIRSRSDGQLLTPPLMLHPIVAALCSPGGTRREAQALRRSRQETVPNSPPVPSPSHDETHVGTGLGSLEPTLDVQVAFESFFGAP